MSGSDEVGRREVAHRLFAAEFEDATLEYKESDEERAPNYVVTPTGARVNRMFVVGVLTELEQVNENVLRARIVDPTGAFVVYAGQYQPDELAFLERVDPPAFLAITGKARTFQPEDSDRVFTSIRPESINRVDAETRDRWIVGTAEQTIDRVATMATALERPEAGEELESLLVDAGATPEHANGIRLALEHYGTTPEYLAAVRDLAVHAAETVAGEREEVSELAVAPGEGDGSVTVDDLPDGLGELPDPVETTDSGADEADTLDDPAESGSEVTASDDDDATASEDDPVTASEDDSISETVDEAPDDSTAEPETETADEEPADTTDESVTAADAMAGGESVGNFETGADETDSEADETAAASDETEPDQDADSIPAESDDSAGTGEMYEFSEDEREEIEEEYGTEFSTGTEVPDPGEADIETPDPDELDESAEEDGKASEDVTATETNGEASTEGADDLEDADATAAEAADADSDDVEAVDDDSADDAADDETGSEEEAGPGEEAVNIPDDVTLTDVVIEMMQELDDGDGVDRYDLIDAVIDETGMTEPDVEDAIEEALMGGRCYEPTDDTLKPI